MRKFLYIGCGLFLAACGFLRVQLFHGQAINATTQGLNILTRVPLAGEPVSIVKARVKESEVQFGIPFSGDEGWINGLSAEVKNTSGKTITDLRMVSSFDSAGTSNRKIRVPLGYSGRMLPNQTALLIPPPTDIASLRQYLANKGMVANFRKAELLMQLAKFEDGSLWVKGVSFGPRDVRTGKRKHSG
jgi:hypothetical protein